MNSVQKAEKIINLLQEEAFAQFPVFPEAFGLLQLQPCILQEGPISTDGTHLFFDADQVCTLFQKNAAMLRWIYLHVFLHVLFGHHKKASKHSQFFAVLPLESEAILSADETADLEVSVLAWMLTKSCSGNTLSYFTPSKQLHDFFSAEYECGNRRTTDIQEGTIQTVLEDKLCLLQPLLHCDSHEKWMNPAADASAETARVSGTNNHFGMHRNPFLSTEQIQQKVFTHALKQTGQHGSRHGKGTGGTEEEAELQSREELDYSTFLHQFMVAREEAILDTDSFDYIPYYYGFSQYGNMPFIEPLEYKEVNRLDELAIAIDTSASCSGRIVRRFLEETWSILRQKENFFSKMRLHLIQCDSMIQEYRIFTSAEELEEAIPDFRVRGLGNTDFTPVFELLEKQIQAGEIRSLRGLLYFTDGDGIFPRTAPSFDTAFVFLNQATEKHEIPDWAIRLNLNLPDEL